MFLIEGVLGTKKAYLAKVARNGQYLSVPPISRPRGPFWGPLAANLDFASGERGH